MVKCILGKLVVYFNNANLYVNIKLISQRQFIFK